MTKQEQIEEMVKTVVDREKNYVIGETECKKCNLNKCDLHCNIHSEISYDCETLYNAGYRKIPEDSVVLSREEYKRLLDNAIRVDMEYLDHELAKTRKKTAKEILQRLYDKCYEVQGLREGYAHIIPLDILILAKEYSVEVQE